jgi:hypothetical protein
VSILNRRNALIGWLVVSVLRRKLRRRAGSALAAAALPAARAAGPRKRRWLRALVVVGALAAGAVALRRKLSDSGEEWETYTAAEEPPQPEASTGADASP